MRRTQRGFTLLEVLLALVIVGMTLSTLMTVAGGSKQLAFRAETTLERSLYVRAALNVAQIQRKSDYPKYPKQYASSLQSVDDAPLEKPARQTRKILYVLAPFHLSEGDDNKAAPVVQGLRWKRLKALE